MSAPSGSPAAAAAPAPPPLVVPDLGPIVAWTCKHGGTARRLAVLPAEAPAPHTAAPLGSATSDGRRASRRIDGQAKRRYGDGADPLGAYVDAFVKAEDEVAPTLLPAPPQAPVPIPISVPVSVPVPAHAAPAAPPTPPPAAKRRKPRQKPTAAMAAHLRADASDDSEYDSDGDGVRRRSEIVVVESATPFDDPDTDPVVSLCAVGPSGAPVARGAAARGVCALSAAGDAHGVLAERMCGLLVEQSAAPFATAADLAAEAMYARHAAAGPPPLPYDAAALTWDAGMHSNTQDRCVTCAGPHTVLRSHARTHTHTHTHTHRYCYCGGPKHATAAPLVRCGACGTLFAAPAPPARYFLFSAPAHPPPPPQPCCSTPRAWPTRRPSGSSGARSGTSSCARTARGPAGRTGRRGRRSSTPRSGRGRRSRGRRWPTSSSPRTTPK